MRGRENFSDENWIGGKNDRFDDEIDKRFLLHLSTEY